MAKPVIDAKAIKEGIPGYTDRRNKARKGNKARNAKNSAMTNFDDKAFADLTGPEKDDLLKALAISAGIIEE